MSGRDEKLKVLVLEPYYGGSHRNFVRGLKRLPFEFKLMTFPARKWKWRMRLAAPVFAQKLRESKKQFDRILCSSFVDAAAFRGLAPEWTRKVPLLTYFHENQFDYPVRIEDERDFHFALTNLTTALASDKTAFNSKYNMDSFLKGAEKLLKLSHDMKLADPAGTLAKRSGVLWPGIDLSYIDRARPAKRHREPVILWNHRWEHDKNPELFFKTLYKLKHKGLDFRVIVLGQSYKEVPPVFEEARKKLGRRIMHFGYAATRKEYAQWLRSGNIIVSTASHEFFGMSVIEAVRAGCRPLLPDRLSYPELFPKEFLYEDKDLVVRLSREISIKQRLSDDRAVELTERFSWDRLAPKYEGWIADKP